MTPEQREERRKSLGASEIAAVCGIDPFRGRWDVWADKMGLSKPDEFAAAEMGHLFERPLLAHYAKRHGVALSYPEAMTHPVYEWVTATPDGMAHDRVVQVKVVGQNMTHKWAGGVPDYVVAQVQWEMLVTGRRRADVVACLGGTDYQEYTVEADADLQNILLSEGQMFWDRVLNGSPPQVDDSQACRKALCAHFRAKEGLIQASPALIETAAEYDRIDKQIKTLSEQRNMLGNVLRMGIGEGSGFEFAGGRVQWKPEKGRPAYKAIAEELGATPELIAKHTTAPERVLRVYIKGEKS